MLPIPTEEDWRSEPWCLDAEWAYKNLAGKTHDEVVQLFEENSLHYQEDLVFMPFACFPYYANAYVSYLCSDAAEGDSDGASCFFSVVESRLDEIKKSNQELMDLMIVTLTFLGENQSFFDADAEIYGSFAQKAEKLAAKLQT